MKRIRYRQKRYKPLLVREEALVDYKVHQSIVNNNLKGIRKDYGMFFTPEQIVDFMVNLIDVTEYTDKKDITILEPACGLAQFLVGIRRNQPALSKQAKLFGVEINQDIINYLTTVNIGGNIKIIRADYLLWQPGSSFDLVIGNPPYGIPSLSKHYPIKIDPDTKEKYKSLYETWYGKYNVYGAFIERSIKLLRAEGQLIFIVPPTFMILDEFRKLRAFLSQNGGTAIIYLGPGVFKPEADVSSVVLNFLKSDKFTSRLELLEYRDNKISTIKVNSHWQGEVVKFETDYTHTIESICSYRLADIYDLRISLRTPEIKHSPYIVKERPLREGGYLPLLNGRNLKCNKVIYNNLTGYWIKKAEVKKLGRYFSVPHIVVGLGFRGNGRVGAAIDERCYPWMGDVYHLLRKNDLFNLDFDLGDSEILDYLNSDYVRRYVKDVYREITYHLSITQLKNLPLPNKKEWREIRRKKIL
ncbi:MAG: DNA methyltransferase [bacterium (Candidatus Ratteibacteria) CG_4_10_14_3_um_filter_41_18]|uniref:site-specific DNA-methyltransferase (adenine-specific) n=3 Tax=Candidatus Ratteibacteria TaxID=2979319 RepID=A0A2M7YH14_9BACT|nr:MAG: DNA methyltransferase [bacterium (Candidatus Ratteibacteria) CG15_BIG_FIL_POST_REV_8_21_14_020_41_12]PIW74396.1 MAG: DNA methyltransferase [bacterium (Candidatus Ratteibacteria) CG_4_8_14_3_um_filter_41_36]PIX77879.1 MAG: DNA methyltransferase [bacterium (Candidatus Ratteibacteria) CG_4_10_14_3_um_filter_41_18]PJA62263.1 MAG: DNA methyltransferase [bacterium (Candidatus Ratteibacteria) CG_4_9_14_3_um_filter_41_21]HCG76895.1 DNA methyltransferase [bacterium]